jgi:hypothetical protein
MTAIQIALGLAGLAITLALYALKMARENEHRFTVLEVRTDMYWKTVEQGAVGLLHHEVTPVLDTLLTKAARDGLSAEEREGLIDRLKQIELDPEKPYGERSTALMVRAALIATQAVTVRRTWWWQRRNSYD